MRIRHISIENFRGIRLLKWAIPDQNIACLIGRGDSTKSTILEAIQRVFSPQWNISFDDSDFYQCKPENPIKIDVVVGDLPNEFRDLGKYGYSLCGWDAQRLCRTDDPGEGLEDAIRARLIVGEDLEPNWSVTKSDDDVGVPFRAPDRAKAAVSMIGINSDRHLTWSRGSVLGKLTDGDGISSSLANAARAAKTALESQRGQALQKFDCTATDVETTARELGVNVSATYKAHLDIEAIDVRVGGLALHDGDMPLRRLGQGSKRMLTTGLQKQMLQSPHITLFDEVEVGLEPHRIARLLKHLKADATGQYFLTTHSPVVLRELMVEDLHVVHSLQGETCIVSANQSAIAESIQGNIRRGAEAFLAPKVIVCEGATEVGFLRGLDDYWFGKEGKDSFAYRGVALFDANGDTKVRGVAENIKMLGYEVAVLADSDSKEFSDADADELRKRGIYVAKWAGGFSIEERVFADAPWPTVLASVRMAQATSGDERVLDQIGTQYGPGFNRNVSAWTDTAQLRAAIGTAAKHKRNGWYKRQDLAYEWAAVISPELANPAISATDLVREVGSLRSWIDNV